MDNKSGFSYLKGKRMIITGASKGIGRGLAEMFVEAGAQIAAVARPSEELSSMKNIKGESGGTIEVFEADLRNVVSIRECVKKIYEKFGNVDILVNNAGMGKPGPALETTEEDWDELIDLNMKSVFFFTQQVAKRMKENGGGKIVMMSSQASVAAIENESTYCASKAGINQMAKVMALEWAPYGIRINCVGPTFVYTPGTAERLDDPEFYQKTIAKIPVGRVGRIEDVGGAVAFFSSKAADMITGTLLLVDGGWTLA